MVPELTSSLTGNVRTATPVNEPVYHVYFLERDDLRSDGNVQRARCRHELHEESVRAA